MTKTKRQRSIEEKVAAESLYERAVAHWVGRRLPDLNVERIYAVDFSFEPDYQLSEYTWQPGDGAILTFKYNGRDNQYPLGETKPGDFLRECSEIYRELLAAAG